LIAYFWKNNIAMSQAVIELPDQDLEIVLSLVKRLNGKILDSSLATSAELAARPTPSIREAFEKLVDLGGLGIENPSAWQREIRQDRPLPGRD